MSILSILCCRYCVWKLATGKVDRAEELASVETVEVEAPTDGEEPVCVWSNSSPLFLIARSTKASSSSSVRMSRDSEWIFFALFSLHNSSFSDDESGLLIRLVRYSPGSFSTFFQPWKRFIFNILHEFVSFLWFGQQGTIPAMPFPMTNLWVSKY